MAEDPTTDDADEASEPTLQHCFHCGRKAEINVEENPDWQCPHCQWFQKTVACPMCKQPVGVDFLPAEARPAAAKPRNR